MMMTKLANRLGNEARRTTWRRYGQFCLVGGSGVVVDMALIWLLADPANLGWNLTLSKVLAAEAAIVNNFLWNDVWTFRGLVDGDAGWRGRAVRFGKFNLICLAGIGLNVLLLQAQVVWLEMNVYLANLISIVAVSGWNFGMNLKFGWHAGTEGRRVGGPGLQGASVGGTRALAGGGERRRPVGLGRMETSDPRAESGAESAE